MGNTPSTAKQVSPSGSQHMPPVTIKVDLDLARFTSTSIISTPVPTSLVTPLDVRTLASLETKKPLIVRTLELENPRRFFDYSRNLAPLPIDLALPREIVTPPSTTPYFGLHPSLFSLVNIESSVTLRNSNSVTPPNRKMTQEPFEWLNEPHSWKTEAQPIISAATESFELNAIKEQVLEFTVIRMLLRRGRGYGHQGAALRIMEELCRLNFKGTFEIVCIDEILDEDPALNPIEKFKKIIKHHDFLSGRITYPNEISHVDLTINPGDDRTPVFAFSTLVTDLFATNSDYYLTVNLANWHNNKHPNWLRILGGSHVRLTSSNSLPDLYHPINTDSFRDTPFVEILSALAYAREKKSCLVELLYGLYPENMQHRNFRVDPMKILTLILKSLINLQNDFQGKPIVMVFPTEEFTASALQKFIKTIGDNVIYTNDMSELCEFLLQPSNNKIMLAQTSRFPKRVFEAILMEYSTLTPIVEGASATRQAQVNRDFLHCGSAYSLQVEELNPDQLLLCGATSEQQALHRECCQALEQGEINELKILKLTEFLIRTYRGDLNNYFAARRNSAASRSNFLYEAFFAISQNPVAKEPILRARLLIKECNLNCEALEKYIAQFDRDNSISESHPNSIINISLIMCVLIENILPLFHIIIPLLTKEDIKEIIDAFFILANRAEKIDDWHKNNCNSELSLLNTLNKVAKQAQHSISSAAMPAKSPLSLSGIYP